MFDEALSPEAVTKLLPVVDSVLEESMRRWEEMAQTGEVGPFVSARFSRSGAML